MCKEERKKKKEARATYYIDGVTNERVGVLEYFLPISCFLP